MVILKTCCCLWTVHQGSYASSTYTLISSILHVLFISRFMATMDKFNIDDTIISDLKRWCITLLFVAILSFLTSIQLFFGLNAVSRFMFLPWIIATILFCIFVFAANMKIYASLSVMKILMGASMIPIISVASFFFILLNSYTILCVISRYQQLKSKRISQMRENVGLDYQDFFEDNLNPDTFAALAFQPSRKKKFSIGIQAKISLSNIPGFRKFSSAWKSSAKKSVPDNNHINEFLEQKPGLEKHSKPAKKKVSWVMDRKISKVAKPRRAQTDGATQHENDSSGIQIIVENYDLEAPLEWKSTQTNCLENISKSCDYEISRSKNANNEENIMNGHQRSVITYENDLIEIDKKEKNVITKDCISNMLQNPTSNSSRSMDTIENPTQNNLNIFQQIDNELRIENKINQQFQRY